MHVYVHMCSMGYIYQTAASRGLLFGNLGDPMSLRHPVSLLRVTLLCVKHDSFTCVTCTYQIAASRGLLFGNMYILFGNMYSIYQIAASRGHILQIGAHIQHPIWICYPIWICCTIWKHVQHTSNSSIAYIGSCLKTCTVYIIDCPYSHISLMCEYGQSHLTRVRTCTHTHMYTYQIYVRTHICVPTRYMHFTRMYTCISHVWVWSMASHMCVMYNAHIRCVCT